MVGFIDGWLGYGRRSTLFFFFFSTVGYGLWCGGGCGYVGRSASVGGWVHRWVALWVDRCVHGGGSGGFRSGGCGCCQVGLVGVDLVDFLFFSLLWVVVVVVVVVAVMYVCSEYIILL